MYIKNISSRQIAMAFTGSFLGAGFVSGQELTQFFAVFGSYGLLGMLLSIIMFYMFGCSVMTVAKKTGITEFDKIIVEKEKFWLRMIFSGVFIFFLFSVVVVMIAGAGALLNQFFGIPTILGNALMAVCLAVVALWEAKGVLAVFSITVPLLILVAMASGFLSFLYFDSSIMVGRPFSGTNPLLGNWLFSTISFVSYNMMAATSILVPIASDVKDENTIRKGILQGSVQLIIVFVCILLPLTLYHTKLAGVELPMLTLAEKIHPVLGFVYAILLFCGMFGSALSCLFGVTARMSSNNSINSGKLKLVLIVTAFIGSVVGFKNLIGVVYPICGYIGFFAMIGISMHFLSLKQNFSVGK